MDQPKQSRSLHLTYCLNIHPGETWAENLAAIRAHAVAVKARVAPDRPFGLGLRLSRAAAETAMQRPFWPASTITVSGPFTPRIVTA